MPEAPCSPGRRSRRATPRWVSVEFSKLLLARAKVAVAPGLGLRRARRGVCPDRAGGEHPPAAPGGAEYPGVPAGGDESGGAGRGGDIVERGFRVRLQVLRKHCRVRTAGNWLRIGLHRTAWTTRRFLKEPPAPLAPRPQWRSGAGSHGRLQGWPRPMRTLPPAGSSIPMTWMHGSTVSAQRMNCRCLILAVDRRPVCRESCATPIRRSPIWLGFAAG